MTNISLTLLCNRSCVYCFARSLIENLGHMPPDVFEEALVHLEHSGIGQARLLGGEPTIHPRFPHFLDMVEARNLDLLLFSNGRIPQKAMDRLARFPRDKLSILLNIHHPETETEASSKRIRQVAEYFGERVILGYNIDSPGSRFDFLLTMVQEFTLASQIRLGLAHPCRGAENRFLHPRHYRTVGTRIGAFARQALDQDIRLELDCGFVPCMFSEDDLDLIRESSGEIPGNRCNPLPDFLPDGRCIPCYPLAKVTHFPSGAQGRSDEIQAVLTKQLAEYRKAGIFASCACCALRHQGICTGGCLAAAMRRLRHGPFPILAGDSEDPTKKRAGQVQHSTDSRPESVTISDGRKLTQWAIPYIDQPLSFWWAVKDRFDQNIGEVYLPLPGTLLPSGRPAQKTERLGEFLRHPPLPVGILLNPVVLPEPVEHIAPAIIEQLRRLCDTVQLQTVTVANFTLARRIKEALPDMSLTASVLMDVAKPQQAMLLRQVFDRLVPASRIIRDHSALHAVKQAFSGTIRLMVNESCLPDCLLRTQHFYEMACSPYSPHSLCQELLDDTPWLRMTGAWVLPQHLHLFADLADEMKLAGRVTLQDPDEYLHVLEAYLTGKDLTPDAIGGGPASLLHPMHISEDFYRTTLSCHKKCNFCSFCRDYFEQAEKR